MRGATALLSRASGWLAYAAGVGTFAMMVLVGADVLFRAFGGGVPATLEIVAHYLMVIVVFLPLARIERMDATITVDALFTMLGPRAQRTLIVFVAIFSTVIYGALAWLAWVDAVHQYAVGAYVFAAKLQLPTWPGYFLLPVALALAAIVTLIRIFEVAADAYEPEGGLDDMAGLIPAADANRDTSDAGSRP